MWEKRREKGKRRKRRAKSSISCCGFLPARVQLPQTARQKTGNQSISQSINHSIEPFTQCRWTCRQINQSIEHPIKCILPLRILMTVLFPIGEMPAPNHMIPGSGWKSFHFRVRFASCCTGTYVPVYDCIISPSNRMWVRITSTLGQCIFLNFGVELPACQSPSRVMTLCACDAVGTWDQTITVNHERKNSVEIEWLISLQPTCTLYFSGALKYLKIGIHEFLQGGTFRLHWGKAKLKFVR